MISTPIWGVVGKEDLCHCHQIPKNSILRSDNKRYQGLERTQYRPSGSGAWLHSTPWRFFSELKTSPLNKDFLMQLNYAPFVRLWPENDSSAYIYVFIEYIFSISNKPWFIFQQFIESDFLTWLGSPFNWSHRKITSLIFFSLSKWCFLLNIFLIPGNNLTFTFNLTSSFLYILVLLSKHKALYILGKLRTMDLYPQP